MAGADRPHVAGAPLPDAAPQLKAAVHLVAGDEADVDAPVVGAGQGDRDLAQCDAAEGAAVLAGRARAVSGGLASAVSSTISTTSLSSWPATKSALRACWRCQYPLHPRDLNEAPPPCCARDCRRLRCLRVRCRTSHCGRSLRRRLRRFDHRAFPASRDRTESRLAVAFARCVVAIGCCPVAALCRIAGVRGRTANDNQHRPAAFQNPAGGDEISCRRLQP